VLGNLTQKNDLRRSLNQTDELGRLHPGADQQALYYRNRFEMEAEKKCSRRDEGIGLSAEGTRPGTAVSIWASQTPSLLRIRCPCKWVNSTFNGIDFWNATNLSERRGRTSYVSHMMDGQPALSRAYFFADRILTYQGGQWRDLGQYTND
jgi:hypothetical protein